MTKNGLNNSDKIFIPIALWISAAALFAVALTLPMLPDRVNMMYGAGERVQYYSKYNNLLLITISIIPAAIALIIATLKKRHRLQYNFPSLILFSIMIAFCMDGIIIYGIVWQFSVNGAVSTVDFNAIIVLSCAFVMSMLSAVAPTIVQSCVKRGSIDTTDSARYANRFAAVVGRWWNVGSYGYILIAIACAFTPGYYAYIPLGVAVMAHVIFMLVFAKCRAPRVEKSEISTTLKPEPKTDVPATDSPNSDG